MVQTKGWNPINDLKHEWNKVKGWLSDRVKQAKRDISKQADSAVKKVKRETDRYLDQIKSRSEGAVSNVESVARHAIGHVESVSEDAIEAVDRAKEELQEVAEEAADLTEKAIQEAIDRLLSGGYETILRKLLQLAKHATKGKKARVALTPFWFEADLGSKVDVLEKIVADPPTDPKDIPDILYALVEDDDVGIGFRIPVVGKVEVPIPIEVIKGKLEGLI